jgi:hypothetical protein
MSDDGEEGEKTYQVTFDTEPGKVYPYLPAQVLLLHLLHCRHTIVTLLLHYCYSVVTLL